MDCRGFETRRVISAGSGWRAGTGGSWTGAAGLEGLVFACALEQRGYLAAWEPVGASSKVLAIGVGAAGRQNELVGFRIDAGVFGKPLSLDEVEEGLIGSA